MLTRCVVCVRVVGVMLRVGLFDGLFCRILDSFMSVAPIPSFSEITSPPLGGPHSKFSMHATCTRGEYANAFFTALFDRCVGVGGCGVIPGVVDTGVHVGRCVIV